MPEPSQGRTCGAERILWGGDHSGAAVSGEGQSQGGGGVQVVQRWIVAALRQRNFVNGLKHPVSKGALGLFIDAGVVAHFANLRVSQGAAAAARSGAE